MNVSLSHRYQQHFYVRRLRRRLSEVCTCNVFFFIWFLLPSTSSWLWLCFYLRSHTRHVHSLTRTHSMHPPLHTQHDTTHNIHSKEYHRKMGWGCMCQAAGLVRSCLLVFFATWACRETTHQSIVSGDCNELDEVICASVSGGGGGGVESMIHNSYGRR